MSTTAARAARAVVEQDLPHDDGLEQTVLGQALNGGRETVEVIRALGVDALAFHHLRHRAIFAAICAQADAGVIDLVTVTDRLREQHVLDDVGGAVYVTSLLEAAPSAANVEYCARRLLDLARRRALITACADIIRTALNPDGYSPEAVESHLAEIGQRLVSHNGIGALDLPHFTAIAAKELCLLPDPDSQIELLGPVLVRRARTLIGAHTGQGKTTLGLQMLKAVVTQGDFLGWTGAGGLALVIDAEQGLRTIKRRLREAGLEHSEAVDYIRVPGGLSLDKNAEEATALEAAFASRPYDVVYFDPLYKLHAGDSNSEREAVDLMRLLDQWRETHGFALLMATHTRKPPATGARFTMHEFFGSGAYLRGAEVILGLEFLRAGYSRLHFFKDRDGDLPTGDRWGLLFGRETGFTRDPHDGEKRLTAPDKIKEVLLATPGMAEAQLKQATGYAERTIRDALGTLGAISKKGRDGVKYWSLPPDQQSLLDREDDP